MSWALRLRVAAVALMVACGPDEDAVCDDLCTHLVAECGYEAFPDLSSCMEGCAYEEAEGADLEDAAECMLDADCDTFEIIQCEQAHGAF